MHRWQTAEAPNSLYVTGRLPLLVALGAVPVVLLSAAGVDAVARGVAAGSRCASLLTLADAAAAPDPRASRVERTVPRRVLLGQSAVGRAAAAQHRARGGCAAACATPGSRRRERPPSGTAIDIPPGERRGSSTIPLLPRRRGELTLASSSSSARTVRCGSPAARRASTRVGAVRVLPPFTARQHLPSRLARLRELDGNTSVQVRGQGTEFDSLREYVRGDDVRSIDWRATARVGDDACCAPGGPSATGTS